MFRIRTWVVVIAVFALFVAACNASTPSSTPAADPVAPAPPVAQTSGEQAQAQEPAATQEPVEEGATALDTPPAEQEADAAPSGEARVFRILAEQSEASYAVEEEFFNRSIRFVTAIGRTSTIDGELTLLIEGNQLQLGDNPFVVDLRTLASDSGQRDRRIRSEWLQSNTFPWAEFRASGVSGFPVDATEGQDIAFELAGEMTIREVTQPLVFDTVARLDGDTLTATAVTYLYMRDFGFEPPNILGMLTVTDGVTVTVNLTAEATQ